jgi:hypothetical protein
MNAKVESLHRPAEFVHRDEREWETIRWPGQTGKMLFHPHPERPTEPNAGIVRYEPGGRHPLHHHEFAQVWYILEGEFPHRPEDVRPGHDGLLSRSALRGRALHRDRRRDAVRPVPGPTTGGKPIYDGRFNMKERKAVEDERTDR